MTDKKILIVDDEPIYFHLFENMIGQEHTVYTSTNGKDAIIKASELFPDLILLDLMLSDMSGLEVCGYLKKDIKTANIPIVIVSSSELHLFIMDIYDLGIVDYIVKPFSSLSVQQTLSYYLKTK